LSCDGKVALEKRPETGLLAGLWQFPNTSGKLSAEDAIGYVEGIGLKTREIIAQVEREHVFTHVQWDMRGIYLDVEGECGDFTWLTPDQIRTQAALPTAFRQFFQEGQYV
jgi:A/G-specific adenine glycosylase